MKIFLEAVRFSVSDEVEDAVPIYLKLEKCYFSSVGIRPLESK
jgi:hypothetical protein